jgi:hypothetical protein
MAKECVSKISTNSPTISEKTESHGQKFKPKRKRRLRTNMKILECSDGIDLTSMLKSAYYNSIKAASVYVSTSLSVIKNYNELSEFEIALKQNKETFEESVNEIFRNVIKSIWKHNQILCLG